MEGIIVSLLLVFILSWLWAEGIDYMAKNHKNYKGDDFLELPNKPKLDA